MTIKGNYLGEFEELVLLSVASQPRVRRTVYPSGNTLLMKRVGT